MFVPESSPAAGWRPPMPLRAEAPSRGGALVETPAAGASGLDEWWPILLGLGVPRAQAEAVAARARIAGIPFQAELLASGLVGEVELFRALARHLGLGFAARIPPERLFMREHHCLAALRRIGGVHSAVAVDGAGGTVLLVAPNSLDIAAMRAYLARYPDIAHSLRIAPPSAMRAAIKARASAGLSRIAVNGLFESQPEFSARFVVNAWQGATLGAAAMALVAGFSLWPRSSLLALHAALSLCFLSCVILRLLAAGDRRRTPRPPAISTVRTDEMPVYTVLVALYKEAEIVPDLLVALGRLVWPRGKLEIKLVCESDDRETLEAIRAQELRSYVEVVEVPPEGPRTKPKALSYALPMTTGELLVLYDAEDRPHPFQLVEAWQRFRQGGEDLACLQAPLVISNRRESWISSMFAFEYAALFHGMLPWLARRGLMLPLGGTSNHFRRAILERVGGWDPCNVTEDADLGLRLCRLGYRTDTISLPTYEDAPTQARVWIPQRTRWLKGWAQTWLVHMRDVRGLMREVGPPSFAVTQVLFPGMVLSALAHSVFVLTILAAAGYFLWRGELPYGYNAILLLDGFNVLVGYGAFLVLGWSSMPGTESRDMVRHVLLTPAYWLLLSLAAWRAMWQLYRRPHHWEKTPHRPSRSVDALPQRRNSGPEPTTFISSSPIALRSRPG